MDINIWLFVLLCFLAFIGFFITLLLVFFMFVFKFEEYPGMYDDGFYYESYNYPPEPKEKPKKRK